MKNSVGVIVSTMGSSSTKINLTGIVVDMRYRSKSVSTLPSVAIGIWYLDEGRDEVKRS